MASAKLSSQDKKDLEKFTKYLVYKCIQIIVQSRLGEKKKSISKPYSTGSDWFNLAIKDLPEVQSETKKVFTSSSLLLKSNINVETSLKTSEGENMILETWTISMDDEKCDTNARVSYTVYNRMSVLLKSLLCVSRVTPAYKLSRNQGSETYVVCYRIYMGEPAFSCLGNGHTVKRVGIVPTPMGTISLKLGYRTKIMFSPHQSMNMMRELSIDLKDDHFKSDGASPKGHTPRPCISKRRTSTTTPEDGVFGESEYCASSFSTSPPSPYQYGTFIGQSPSQRRRKHSSGERDGSRPHSIDENGHIEIPAENKNSLSKGLKMGAFASQTTITEQPKSSTEEDIPFSMLLPQPDTNANKQVTIVEANGLNHNGESIPDNANHVRHRHPSAESNKSTGSEKSGPGDFVMVELKTPFAGPEGNSELGRFYRECQGAPPLTLFENEQSSTSHDVINIITDQLSTFEAHSKDFDDFVDSLQVEEV